MPTTPQIGKTEGGFETRRYKLNTPTTIGAGLKPTLPSPEGPPTPPATTVGAGLKPALPAADGATNA